MDMLNIIAALVTMVKIGINLEDLTANKRYYAAAIFGDGSYVDKVDKLIEFIEKH